MWLAALFATLPIGVHVETPPPWKPAQEAAVQELVAALDALAPGQATLDTAFGPCAAPCLDALHAAHPRVLLVRVWMAVRRIRLELAFGRDPEHVFAVIEGVPSSEGFRASLRRELEPLTMAPELPHRAVAAEVSASAPASPWLRFGAIALASAAVAFSVGYAADTTALGGSLTLTPEAASIDARRQVTGPMALGCAAGALLLWAGDLLL